MKIKSACLEFGRLWRVFAPMFVSKLHCWCIFLSRVRRCEHNWKCFGKSSDAKSIFVFDKKRTGRPDVHITFAGCQFGWAAELYRPGLTMQFQWEATKKDSNTAYVYRLFKVILVYFWKKCTYIIKVLPLFLCEKL